MESETAQHGEDQSTTLPDTNMTPSTSTPEQTDQHRGITQRRHGASTTRSRTNYVTAQTI